MARERDRQGDRAKRARKAEPATGVDAEGAPGTASGRAGTAGHSGENVAHPDRDPNVKKGAAGEVTEPTPEEVAAEEANEGEGLSGRGLEASGSLPGSVGGTTGVAGENAGVRSPGAGVPDFPGISPEEAERLRRRRRR